MTKSNVKAIKQVKDKGSAYVLAAFLTFIIIVVSFSKYYSFKQNNLKKAREECFVSKIYSFKNEELIRYHEDYNDCMDKILSSSAFWSSLVGKLVGGNGEYKSNVGECFPMNESLSKLHIKILESCYREVDSEND